MMIAIAHAAPTAPAPIIPIFIKRSSLVGLSEAIGTTNLSESQKRNRAAQIAIPQPGKRCTFHR
jgi:hypothetical protein